MEQAREAAHVVTEFFQGNPFGTQVGRMIEQATDDSLPSENWALNMDICDAINSLVDGPKDAVRAIRRRLQLSMGKNNTVVLYTLTVLETSIKNCDSRFVQLAMQKEFCQELIKFIGSKYDPPTIVQEKVLGLIQSWADAFRGQPDYKGVCDVYDELKAKGVDFPMTDVDSMVPIITPKKVVIERNPSRDMIKIKSSSIPASHQAAANPILLNQEQLTKLRSELDIVNGNIKVLREMLAELHPGKEDPDDFQLLQDLHKTCKQMQQRLVSLLQRVANEEVTSELLMINDEMNNVFTKCDRYFQNRCSSGNSRAPDDKSLIDFEAAKQDELNITLGAAAQQKGSREPLVQPELGKVSADQHVSQAAKLEKDENMFAL